jgi:Uma2 family endonuclease
MTVLLKSEYTPEDLLEMEHGPRYELVNGRLVEKVMGAEAAWVEARLTRYLDGYGDRTGVGGAFGSTCGYHVFPHEPKRVRYPDVSFIRAERLPAEGLSRGHSRIFPDLAVEVASPNDKAEDIDGRVKDFLRAGTPLVWVVYPATRSVDIFRGDGTGGWRTEDQELTGDDVLPGFSCRLADLFRGLTPRAGGSADPPE